MYSWLRAQDLRTQLHVARLVHAVHVAERGGDREAVADLHELLVGEGDLLRLGVQVVLVGSGVVDAVLLAARDAELDLEGHPDRRRALEVALARRHVLLQRLLGEVEHVRAEQRPAVLGEVLLADLEQTVDPPELVLGAVVGVQDDARAVRRGERVDVRRTRQRAEDRRPVAATDALAGDERGATVGELDDHRRAHRRRRLHDTVHRVRAGAVDRREGEPLALARANTSLTSDPVSTPASNSVRMSVMERG